jgi:hypothetical protein
LGRKEGKKEERKERREGGSEGGRERGREGGREGGRASGRAPEGARRNLSSGLSLPSPLLLHSPHWSLIPQCLIFLWIFFFLFLYLFNSFIQFQHVSKFELFPDCILLLPKLF